MKIIENSDLSDMRYLYQFGEYVTQNEEEMAKFLSEFSQEEIDKMARTFSEGYRIGFVVGKKDLSKKKTVNIRYQLGFERMVKICNWTVCQDGASSDYLSKCSPCS